MFGPSNFNADDLDDYLVIQRDWEVDGGLRSVSEADLRKLRSRAARAVQAVYRHLGLAEIDDTHVEAAVSAHGSQDLPAGDPLLALNAARTIGEKGLTAIDLVVALARTGFAEEAESVLGMLKER